MEDTQEKRTSGASHSERYKREKEFVRKTVLNFVLFNLIALENMLRDTGYYLELLGPLTRCRHDIQKLLDIPQKKEGNRND